MAKAKDKTSVSNRSIYSRASYLYQAANYLAKRAHESEQASAQKPQSNGEHSVSTSNAKNHNETKTIRNMSRHAAAEMRAVSLKAQVRQTPELKRTICKFCDTLQVEGQTCDSTVENLSKEGKKTLADVLVMKCNTCGHAKRFPVLRAPRQQKRKLRAANAYEAQAPGLEAEENASGSTT